MARKTLQTAKKAASLNGFLVLANVENAKADEFEQVLKPPPLFPVTEPEGQTDVAKQVAGILEERAQAQYVNQVFEAFAKQSPARARDWLAVQHAGFNSEHAPAMQGRRVRAAVIRDGKHVFPFYESEGSKQDLYWLRHALRGLFERISNYEPRTPGEPVSIGVPVVDRIGITADGKIDMKLSTPWSALREILSGVQATRIRSCPICAKYFYSLRKDKKACSSKCVGVHRVRRWRDKQAEYERTRRINRDVREKRISIGEANARERAREPRRSKSTGDQRGKGHE
jgi:hypothetical protein